MMMSNMAPLPPGGVILRRVLKRTGKGTSRTERSTTLLTVQANATTVAKIISCQGNGKPVSHLIFRQSQHPGRLAGANLSRQLVFVQPACIPIPCRRSECQCQNRLFTYVFEIVGLGTASRFVFSAVERAVVITSTAACSRPASLRNHRDCGWPSRAITENHGSCQRHLGQTGGLPQSSRSPQTCHAHRRVEECLLKDKSITKPQVHLAPSLRIRFATIGSASLDISCKRKLQNLTFPGCSPPIPWLGVVIARRGIVHEGFFFSLCRSLCSFSSS